MITFSVIVAFRSVDLMYSSRCYEVLVVGICSVHICAQTVTLHYLVMCLINIGYSVGPTVVISSGL